MHGDCTALFRDPLSFQWHGYKDEHLNLTSLLLNPSRPLPHFRGVVQSWKEESADARASETREEEEAKGERGAGDGEGRERRKDRGEERGKEGMARRNGRCECWV